jgi:hypothetical protein
VVLVEGRPERSSPSTDIRPFLKRLGKSFVGLRLAQVIVIKSFFKHFTYVSEAVLPSLKQNLMQIRCSFTSVILAVRYVRKRALTRRQKNAQKKNTFSQHNADGQNGL